MRVLFIIILSAYGLALQAQVKNMPMAIIAAMQAKDSVAVCKAMRMADFYPMPTTTAPNKLLGAVKNTYSFYYNYGSTPLKTLNPRVDIVIFPNRQATALFVSYTKHYPITNSETGITNDSYIVLEFTRNLAQMGFAPKVNQAGLVYTSRKHPKVNVFQPSVSLHSLQIENPQYTYTTFEITLSR